jgi:hypothetical protein
MNFQKIMESLFQEQMQLPSLAPQSSQIQSLMDNTCFTLQSQQALSFSQVCLIFFVQFKKHRKKVFQSNTPIKDADLFLNRDSY